MAFVIAPGAHTFRYLPAWSFIWHGRFLAIRMPNYCGCLELPFSYPSLWLGIGGVTWLPGVGISSHSSRKTGARFDRKGPFTVQSRVSRLY